jgi:phosphate transport system protein
MNTTAHISSQFDHDLNHVRDLIMSMGGLIEQQLDNALRALIHGDIALGEQASAGDVGVNKFETDIDHSIVEIIATRQPAANDLRFLFTASKIVADMERVGDKAEKIARIALVIQPLINSYSFMKDIRLMGEMTQKMLHDVLDAFARMDAEAAIAIKQSDTHVNNAYREVLADLMEHMADNPNTLDYSLNILSCMRAIERVGDHVTNICEYIVYLDKGVDVRHLNLTNTVAKIESV